MPPRKRDATNIKATLHRLLQHYRTILVVDVSHVGSSQLAKVEKALDGVAELLTGRIALIRAAIREHSGQQDDVRIRAMLPLLRGSCRGLIFTNGNVRAIRDILTANRKSSWVRPGLVSPSSIHVESGSTSSLSPMKVALISIVGVPTKVHTDRIDVTSKRRLVEKGELIGQSMCHFLDKLALGRIECGLQIKGVYCDGVVFRNGGRNGNVWDLSERDLIQKFHGAVRVTAALGLRLGIPNAASVPYSFRNTFENMLALSIQSGVAFDAAKSYKVALDNPKVLRRDAASANRKKARHGHARYTDDTCICCDGYDSDFDAKWLAVADMFASDSD